MLNSLVIIGRLTRDPIIRNSNGNAIADITIANDFGVKNGEKQTLFLNGSVFGQQAEWVGKYFKKGSQIALQGRLTSRKYTNKDGIEVTAYEINVSRADFVDSKAASQEEGVADVTPAKPAKPTIENPDIRDEDLPW